MELLPRAIVGLTGAFGSGCTTAAKYLRDTRGFVVIRLSDTIRTEWSKHHKEEPSRLELQRLGDELRQNNHPAILVQLALKELSDKNAGKLPEYVVVDGIRNVAEITHLRDTSGYRFTLLAVLASNDARWDRIGSGYTDRKLTRADFVGDDQRDKNEETDYGQQVELCVDKADILIDNTSALIGESKSKVVEFVDLVTGKKLRGATQS